MFKFKFQHVPTTTSLNFHQVTELVTRVELTFKLFPVLASLTTPTTKDFDCPKAQPIRFVESFNLGWDIHKFCIIVWRTPSRQLFSSFLTTLVAVSVVVNVLRPVKDSQSRDEKGGLKCCQRDKRTRRRENVWSFEEGMDMRVFQIYGRNDSREKGLLRAWDSCWYSVNVLFGASISFIWLQLLPKRHCEKTNS